ncbi:CU044_5270 family protein [Nonomuraea sp. NPDC026600]|uniref:CU044_5270 family protein n=1 Tax=Nonomuraea sp. NPDC026600 TaxID=3155363 RepID=UPI0033E41D82
MKLVTTPIRPMLAIGIGLAAVSAIALLGLPSAPGLLDAPNLRLAAAVTTPAEGAYWHTRTLWKTTHPRQLGSGSNRYWVEEQRLRELWTSPEGKAWFGFRTLATRPKSAADEKAWRRDGSPTKWNRTADGRTVSLSAKADKGRVTAVKGTGTFFLDGQQLTFEEVQKLPADPNGLKAWLAKAARVLRIPEDRVDGNVRGALPTLLRDLPAPKEVRAAAYQALLTMPGVRSLGKVKDSLGRTGVRLSIDQEQARKEDMVRTELIVDTDEMVLLAQNQTTKLNGKPFPNKTYTETVFQVGWTDAEPAVPALP